VADGLASLNVKNDLLGGSGNIPPSNSVVVKAMASAGNAGVCNASTVGTGADVLMTAQLVWGTTLQPLPHPTSTESYIPTRTGLTGVITTITSYSTTETSFASSTLSAAELSSITSQCAARSPGLCNSCKVGAQ
jgi:hypothetical protein